MIETKWWKERYLSCILSWIDQNIIRTGSYDQNFCSILEKTNQIESGNHCVCIRAKRLGLLRKKNKDISTQKVQQTFDVVW